MRLPGLVFLCVVIGAWVAGSILRRAGVEWGASVSYFAALAARFGAAIVFALVAVRAAERGGVWFDALAVLMVSFAALGFALVGVLAWAWMRARRNS